VASDRETSLDLVKPEGTPAEVFTRVLDATIGLLDPEQARAHGVPDDDLHRDILLPLLPAMLGDKVIRQYWREQITTGFITRLGAHLAGDADPPQWLPADFEIHVAASYSAGPDAKALADTLLSEESMRDLTAALMNQLSEPAWAQLPKAKEAPVEAEFVQPLDVEISASERVVEETIGGMAEIATDAHEAVAHESLPKVPALRPVPWNTRRNPIRCGSSLGFNFPNCLAVNPLKPWKSDGPI
jgi:hypothetical protein